MERAQLETALAESFDGTQADRRAVARAARDLADSGKPAEDRGHALDVADVCRHLADAPDGSAVVDRWNWWMGALEAAYGGYDYFTVQFVEENETADRYR